MDGRSDDAQTYIRLSGERIFAKHNSVALCIIKAKASLQNVELSWEQSEMCENEPIIG